MGYRLTLAQIAFILDLFYSGVSMRRVSRLFRTTYQIPVSPSKIERLKQEWVKKVDDAINIAIEKREDGFVLVFGDIWEVDEIYIKQNKTYVALMIVRDLKTGFDLGINIIETKQDPDRQKPSITSNEVTIALENARKTAHRCPKELRCDGLQAYEKAVEKVFGHDSILTIRKRVDGRGQNQSIEGHNGVLRSRIKAMKSLHGKESSIFTLKGLIINYNYVDTSPALYDMTPYEMASGKTTVDGRRTWLSLLELARKHEPIPENQFKPETAPELRKTTLDFWVLS